MPWTPTCQTDANLWWSHHAGPQDSPERAMLIALFEGALNDWIGRLIRPGTRKPKPSVMEPAHSRYMKRRRTDHRRIHKELAQEWFEDRERWDVTSFNYVAQHVLGVNDLEKFRKVILQEPDRIRQAILESHEQKGVAENSDVITA